MDVCRVDTSTLASAGRGLDTTRGRATALVSLFVSACIETRKARGGGGGRGGTAAFPSCIKRKGEGRGADGGTRRGFLDCLPVFDRAGGALLTWAETDRHGRNEKVRFFFFFSPVVL